MTDPTPVLAEPENAATTPEPSTAAVPRPQPQDHLPSRTEKAREVDLDLEEFRATLPPMKDPNKLRIRDRNGILNLAAKLDELTASKPIDVDTDQGAALDPETLQLLDLLADFDEWAQEHLALDLAAYEVWASEGDVYSKLGNLLGLYGSAVGESVSSSS